MWEMLAAAVIGSVISSMMSGSGDEPAAAKPEVKAPTPMPTPGDQPSKAAKRLSLKRQRERRGRASTILTSDSVASDTLGA